jgi:hypothetical protein
MLDFVGALAFQGSIAAILTLYGAYWYQLNMFLTLKILIPLLLIFIVSGKRVLSKVYQMK